MTISHAHPDSPHSLILQLSMGALVAKALSMVAELGIADELATGAKSAETLARATGTHGPSLQRVLRLLSSHGVFVEDEERRFSLTAAGHTLRRDAPGSTREWVRFSTQPWRWELLQAMKDVVTTSHNAYACSHGKDAYAFFGEHPEIGVAFGKAMRSWSASLPAALLEVYDFGKASKLADIGGGIGNLLFPILRANPELHAVLLDVPAVIEQVAGMPEHAALAERCTLVGGDFLVAVPEQCDLYMIASVLMDRTDEQCLRILRLCREAMRDGAKLLVIEPLEGAPHAASLGRIVDVTMMMETLGRLREEAQWRELLQAAGFGAPRIIPVAALSTYVLEASPA